MRHLLVLLLTALMLCVSCKNETEGGKDDKTTASAELENPGNNSAPTETEEPTASGKKYMGYDVEGKEWVLTKYIYEGKPERPVGEDPIHLSIKGNRLTGNGGCNDINGQVMLKDDGSADVSGIAKTKKMCGGQMIQEIRIIQLLEEAETFKVNLVFLEFNGPNGQLTFRNDLN